MTVNKMLKYWIFTVLIGSVLISGILTISGGESYVSGPVLFGIFGIGSFLCSIPAVLVFWAVIDQLQYNNRSLQEKNQLLFITNLLCGLVTFVLIHFIIGTPFIYLLLLWLVYGGLGIIFWLYEMKKTRNSVEEMSNQA